jgi:hypothetical protein
MKLKYFGPKYNFCFYICGMCFHAPWVILFIYAFLFLMLVPFNLVIKTSSILIVSVLMWYLGKKEISEQNYDSINIHFKCIQKDIDYLSGKNKKYYFDAIEQIKNILQQRKFLFAAEYSAINCLFGILEREIAENQEKREKQDVDIDRKQELLKTVINIQRDICHGNE